LPLKKLGLAAGMIILGAALALLDLSLFFLAPGLAWVVHNLLAIGVGGTLAGASWKLLGRTSCHRRVLLLNLLVGIGMIVIHATKLVWGNCA
jgi:hypothetical protein